MGRLRKIVFSAVFALLLVSALPCRAAIDEVMPDANALAQMELRARLAKPREQCYLYTELVHVYTEIAGKQFLAGDIEQATLTLKHVEQYAELIHLNLANDTKRLMNAQLLMHHTTRRLDEYVHHAAFEDRETLQATLKQLTQVEDELLNQVFTH
jgi:hypothetical protein